MADSTLGSAAEWQQSKTLECRGCHRKVKATLLWVTADTDGIRAYYDCGRGHAILVPLTAQQFVEIGLRLSGERLAQTVMEMT